MEIVRGRSSMNENTPQIIQKKAPKLAVEIVNAGSSMDGRTPQILRKTPTKGQWKAVNEM